MPGIYEMYVKKHFCAAHSLKGYPGDCARMHGHNWMIEVYIRCRELDNIGMGIDLREIKQGVGDVLDDLDHANLDELPAFRDQNPTSENIARLLYVEIGKRLNSERVSVSKVKVCETPGAGSFYWED